MWSMKSYLREMEVFLAANLDACVVELKSEREGIFLGIVGKMSRHTGLGYWTCFELLKDLVWRMEEERVRAEGSGWVGKVEEADAPTSPRIFEKFPSLVGNTGERVKEGGATAVERTAVERQAVRLA